MRKFLQSALFIIIICNSILISNSYSENKSNYCTKIYINDSIEVSFYTESMFRFRISYLKENKFPTKYEIPYIIGKYDNWGKVEYKLWEENGLTVIGTNKIKVIISTENKGFSVWTSDGKTKIHPSIGPVHGIFKNGYTLFDNASAFDEPNNNSRYSHWFYNLETGRYVDTYLEEDLIMDKYFIYGPDYKSLFYQFNLLVGPEPLLPKKAYGFFQTQHLGCKGDQTQLIELASKLREQDIPCDNLIIDFEWGDGCPGEDEKYWGGLDWSKKYSSPLSPKELLTKLDSMNFDVMLIHHSAPNFPNREINTKYKKRKWTSKVYDEQIWWNSYKNKLDIGIAGTWQDTRQNDLTDSEIYSGTQKYYGKKRRALFMGCRKMMEQNPWEHDRDNTIAVNHLMGSRRYPFRWTGDIDNTFSEMKWQIEAITNSQGSMKGISYITNDVFSKNWKVAARWNQFIDFNSVSRSHTTKPWENSIGFDELTKIMDFRKNENDEYLIVDNSQSKKDINLNTELVENSIRLHRKLRYRLLPYIYSTAYENYLTGIPICRPMLLAFPDDYRCKQNQFPYQYMFGESILVAPVIADLTTMEIYLPKDFKWIDYWNKKEYNGGQLITYDTRDVGKLPLFIKSGSILPMRKEQNWIVPSEQDSILTLDIYPSDSSSFTLFEDDGNSTKYQKGEFGKTIFQCETNSTDILIRISKMDGDYTGKLLNRSLISYINLIKETPSEVFFNDKSIIKTNNYKTCLKTSNSWFYDNKLKYIITNINISTDIYNSIRIEK